MNEISHFSEELYQIIEHQFHMRLKELNFYENIVFDPVTKTPIQQSEDEWNMDK